MNTTIQNPPNTSAPNNDSYHRAVDLLSAVSQIHPPQAHSIEDVPVLLSKLELGLKALLDLVVENTEDDADPESAPKVVSRVLTVSICRLKECNQLIEQWHNMKDATIQNPPNTSDRNKYHRILDYLNAVSESYPPRVSSIEDVPTRLLRVELTLATLLHLIFESTEDDVDPESTPMIIARALAIFICDLKACNQLIKQGGII